MSKSPTSKADNDDIPVFTREQLGKGVRGKYLRQSAHGSNVVALRPEIHKAFPTSEAVNQALEHLLAATSTVVRKPVRGRA